MTEYNKLNPFFGKIIERRLLSNQESSRSTYHLSVDLTGSDITYQVGDAIGILPENDPLIVNRILRALKATGDEMIIDHRSNAPFPLEKYLLRKVNLNRITSALIKLLYQIETAPVKKKELENLLSDDNKAMRLDYLSTNHLVDLLEQHKHLTVPLQPLLQQLPPLLPRLYSIASAQCCTENEAHLLIATLSYEIHGDKRTGVGSHFLCENAEINTTPIPLYYHPSPGFTLPEDPKRPIIMIGPGTGVAPFRGFLQERVHTKAPGENWLFFGERSRATDFYYEDELLEYEKENHLRLDLAFSRDQEKKIYVQDKMRENQTDLWQWIGKGAYIYVCGDRKRMAKDVNLTLHEIAEKEGKMSPDEAKAFIKDLRQQKRYLMDVY